MSVDFVEIKKVGNATVAVFSVDFGRTFNINLVSLKNRIKTLKRQGLDTMVEESVLPLLKKAEGANDNMRPMRQ